MTAEQPKDATLLQLLLLQNGPPLLERVIAAVGGKGVPTLRCVCKTMREEVDRLVEKVHLTADAVEEVCLDGGLIDRLPALRKVVLCNEASHSAAPAAALLMRLCEQSSCSRYLRSFRLIGQGRDARTPCGAPLTLLTRWADTLRHLTLDRPALCSPSLLMLKKLTSLESLVLRSGVLGIECRAPLAQLDALSNLTRLVFDINIREYADAYDDEQADGAMYTFLGGMHRLQVLDLGDAYFDATCIAILAALPALESLALARSDPTDVMFLPPDAPLQLPESPFSKLTRLRAERFNTIDRLGSGVMGRILGAMPALRNLHLSFSDWGDLDGVLAVKGLERLTVEESEMDEGPAITDGWLLRLSRACTNLVSLSLWTDSYYDGISADDAAVTASGFALLPSALTRLESLELRGFTCVRPESLVALCLASPSLRQLRLRLVEYAATSGMTSAEQEAALDDLRGVAAARLPHPLLVAVESDDEDGDQDDEDSYKYFDETDDDEGGGSGAVE